MASVKWIKIVTDIFDDEKILLIETLPEADSIIVIWFKLLCLAGKQNNSGVFMLNDRMPYNEKMFATIFRRKEATIQLALKTFEEFGMIEILDGAVTIPNWGKHQTLDQIEQKNEYMRNYMRRYREKQRLLACKTNSKTNSKANVSCAEEDKKENKNKNKNKEPPYPLTEFGFSNPLQEKVQEWLTYKAEKKDTYKPTGFKSLMLKIQKQAAEYGEQAVMDLIDECMAANWKGIVWDKLQQRKNDRSGNPFKEALRKELEYEKNRGNSNNDRYQGGLSKLLSEPRGD